MGLGKLSGMLVGLLFATPAMAGLFDDLLKPKGGSKAGGTDHWEELLQAKAAAEAVPAPTDNASYEAGEKAWDAFNSAGMVYKNQDCDAPSKAKHCGAENDEALAAWESGWVAYLDKAIAAPGVTFDVLQDDVFSWANSAEDSVTIASKVDGWIETISAKKTKYWQDQFAKYGGIAEYVENRGESICVPLPASNAAKPADISKMKYHYKAGETVYFRCFFVSAPSAASRDQSDQWVVQLRWYGKNEFMRSLDLESPASTTTAEYKLPLGQVDSSIEKATSKGNRYPGSWFWVRASYNSWTKNGGYWADNGVWQDNWVATEHGAGTAFYKMK